MKRFWIGISLALLGAFLLGLMLGEADAASRAIGAAKVRLTGCLPLRDWRLPCSDSFWPEAGWWDLAGAQWEDEPTLFHRINVGEFPPGLLGAKALELELSIPHPRIDPDDLIACQFTVAIDYGGDQDEEITFSGEKLVDLAVENPSPYTGCSVRLNVPIDSTRRLYRISLRVGPILPAKEIIIRRSNLILR